MRAHVGRLDRSSGLTVDVARINNKSKKGTERTVLIVPRCRAFFFIPTPSHFAIPAEGWSSLVVSIAISDGVIGDMVAGSFA